MRRILPAFVMLAAALGASSADAVNVRGRADIRTPTNSYPMNAAHVELCTPDTKRCQAFMTGYDGMYYFSVDPGRYVVRINGVVRREVVINNVPSFDIPGLQGNR